MNNYYISYLLNQMKIGKAKKVLFVETVYTNTNYSLLDIFFKIGIISGFKKIDNKKLRIFLKYKNNKSVIKDIQLVSKPTKRVYWSKRVILNNLQKSDFFGFYIISTKKGLVTNFSYLYNNINFGGEVIIKIYV